MWFSQRTRRECFNTARMEAAKWMVAVANVALEGRFDEIKSCNGEVRSLCLAAWDAELSMDEVASMALSEACSYGVHIDTLTDDHGSFFAVAERA